MKIVCRNIYHLSGPQTIFSIKYWYKSRNTKNPGPKRSFHLGEQFTQRRRHWSKNEQKSWKPSCFLRVSIENPTILDFTRSFRFTMETLRKHEYFYDFSSLFSQCRRIWVNCSPRWNDIFAPGFFVLRSLY